MLTVESVVLRELDLRCHHSCLELDVHELLLLELGDGPCVAKYCGYLSTALQKAKAS